ncbi:hypothetical protein [Alicyclobacillus dauci]|uniref:Uncharacterized protein n=1 Tax=Alicyclobacillus dauci TaxID=1475485 RepID=A0ABY6Z9L1_9BACL|nr:hypothetical protein [Alicyclobacillus dauci]WAH39507.1 hypothetical protein NZD86_24380 [Alicyclobacillus dauci]WAH39567.1 hypothetical protein NZD86_24080 [Alicyclobacillus dauci]
MANRLSDIHRKYEDIIRSDMPPYEKDKALARLMTDMEREFHVPALKNEQWEAENKPIIALYRVISESRTTL